MGRSVLRQLNRYIIAGAFLSFLVIAFIACSNGTQDDRIAGERSPTLTRSTLPPPSQTVVSTPTSRRSDPSRTAIPSEPRTISGATSCSSTQVLAPRGTSVAYSKYEPLAYLQDEALEDVVRQSLGVEIQHFGVVVTNLANGRTAMVNAHRVFSSASLYKVWVMLEIYHQLEGGLLDLGEEYLVTDYYAGLGLNSGELAPCTVVTANHALGAMMSTSDNVAARMLLDRVGIVNLNSGLRTLGLHPSGFSENGPHVTARDMALVFEAISIGEVMNASAHQGMMSLLYTETIDNRLPALLPTGTLVAHKTGSRIDATHDAGVVVSPKATYVVVVLSDYGFSTNAASRIAHLSRDIYDYYNNQRKDLG